MNAINTSKEMGLVCLSVIGRTVHPLQICVRCWNLGTHVLVPWDRLAAASFRNLFEGSVTPRLVLKTPCPSDWARGFWF